MLRRLYDWCIAAADKPYATWLLGIVSFVESSFFPVPPDAMLIPMALARPDRAWFYATVCTTTSVAGGILGYLIGALLYDSVGLWLIKFSKALSLFYMSRTILMITVGSFWGAKCAKKMRRSSHCMKQLRSTRPFCSSLIYRQAGTLGVNWQNSHGCATRWMMETNPSNHATQLR